MKIAVDAGCLGTKDERLRVGVYTVVRNLLIELGKIDSQNQYLLYSFLPIEKSLLQQLGANVRNVLVQPAFGWMKVALPLRLLLDKPDLFIAANQATPLRLPLSRYKTLGIFYDIAFEKYPELYYYAANVSKHKKYSRELAEKADTVVAISQTTKNDLVKYYHVPEKKITVAYPGIDSYLRLKVQDVRHKNPYFLFVGAMKKSKNIPFLLRAFNEFSQKSEKKYDLLLVGGNKWMDPKIETALESLPWEVSKRIKVLGFVNATLLASLYKRATAFVSPSLYEGFGLTFLEAQSLGCPVIGSNRGSLPEIIGDSGILVDPIKIDELVSAMVKITQNISLRRTLIQKGRENSKKYSWKSFAKSIQSAIEQVV